MSIILTRQQFAEEIVNKESLMDSLVHIEKFTNIDANKVYEALVDDLYKDYLGDLE